MTKIEEFDADALFFVLCVPWWFNRIDHKDTKDTKSQSCH